MQPLLAKLRRHYPSLQFRAGRQFCWSPESQEIFYKRGTADQTATWSLLHETGHALLNHTTYHADYELLRLEIDAWQKAQEIGQLVAITIDQEHIEDCLDTYRDWLYKRCICPHCASKCLQSDDLSHYRCFNCHTIWRVSANRFGRAYRSIKNIEPAPIIFK